MENILNGLGNDFNERGIGVIEVSKINSCSKVEGFYVANAMKNFEHKLDEDFGLYPKVVHLEKIVELRRVRLYPLGSFMSLQTHIGNFVQTWIEFFAVQVVQGDDH